ncbi:hypothetical protein D3C77_526430 [compost metagenome]
MILSAEHMSDLHQMVIKHHRKIVSWNAVFFHNDKVTACLGLKRNLPFDQIIECIRAALRHTEADACLTSLRFECSALLRRQIAVFAGITRRLSAGNLFLALLL